MPNLSVRVVVELAAVQSASYRSKSNSSSVISHLTDVLSEEISELLVPISKALPLFASCPLYASLASRTALFTSRSNSRRTNVIITSQVRHLRARRLWRKGLGRASGTIPRFQVAPTNCVPPTTIQKRDSRFQQSNYSSPPVMSGSTGREVTTYSCTRPVQ